MKEAIIEWKDFSFRYETQQEPTLQGIDLTIYKGEKVLIVGPSGSGKSTLGQCLNGIIPNIYKGQTYGEFLIKGQVAFDMSIYDKSHLDNMSISKGQVQLQNELAKETPELQSLFKLEDVSFSYDDRPILKSLHLDIKKGEKIAIVGKNGAGKSTLAKAISSFIQTEGRYLWEKQDIKGDSVAERAERVGYVLQNPNQMISTNMIFDEVALGLRLRGVDEKEIETRVYETLKICGLYEFRNWPISALSFGQKKRVTIASILVLGAEIILLDEPTAGQDQKNYTEIMEFLEELHQKGHTIVMITHDMQLMLDYSDRVLVMVDGELIADTVPASLLSDPELLVKANLKETSIFNLAKKLDVDPLDLTAFYKERREGCKLN